jgi:alcohol dehydrogenase (cytochrome c)
MDMKGMVYAYDAGSGTELWRFNTGSGTRGGIISYMADGEQYILVPSGIGSAVSAITAGIYPEVGDIPAGSSLFAFKVQR